MEFITRAVVKHMNLVVVIDDNRIDLGLHDEDQILDLVYILDDAIQDFRRYLGEKDFEQ